MQFEKLYNNSSDSLKLKFLNGIIQHNTNLQSAFVNFILSEQNDTEAFPMKKFMEIISSTKEKYQFDFEAVDLENPDWDNYHAPHSGYIEDWEAYQQASEQEFEAIFNSFVSEAVNKILAQKPVELSAMLIGLYEATQDAEIEDDNETFGDVNEHLLDEFNSSLQAITNKLKIAAINEKHIITTFEKFTEYADAEYPGNPHFVSYFEHFFIALAEKSTNANQILSIVDKSTIERQSVPELILLLNKISGNKSEWLQSATQFYRINKEVAKQLLQFYFESDKLHFVKTAIELFSSDKRFWADFLKDYITPELDRVLYINVFYQLTVDTEDINHYMKIREYLTETDLIKLLEGFTWNKVFSVRILEVEKRYESIKKIVEKNSEDWHYGELIRPILGIYPEFCFSHIKNKAVRTIETQRGRDVYERVSSWLKLTERIAGFDTEKRDLIMQLFNHKPNLPALKDEMRKAKLV
jgi:hypothetical protein